MSYTYDGLGNITSAEKNGETEGTWVYDSKNPDLLIAYKEAAKEQADGQKNSKKGTKKATVKANIKYDKAGNPIKYSGKALTWNHGRNLAKLSDQNKQVQYTYTKDGIRLSKNVYDKKNKTSEKTTYILNGSIILSQKTGDETLNFYYDADGKVIGIGYNKGDGPEKEYMLARNAFGDVESIYTAEGTHVGSYLYDPYGKIMEIRKAEGYTDAEDILSKNPFRYRGYYYDTETGWYYLNSRYYDPVTKRFINADDVSYLGAGEEVNSYNLFAYCGGDPVNGVDESGNVTISTGYSASFSPSGFVFSLQIGIVVDAEGNVEIQYTPPTEAVGVTT